MGGITILESVFAARNLQSFWETGLGLNLDLDTVERPQPTNTYV